MIYIVGAFIPPIFGALVDRNGFSYAWDVLAVIVAVGIIPGIFARQLLSGLSVAART